MRVLYSCQAQADLHEIYEYIAQTLLSPENAASTAKCIMEAARKLETMPGILFTEKNLGEIRAYGL